MKASKPAVSKLEIAVCVIVFVNRYQIELIVWCCSGRGRKRKVVSMAAANTTVGLTHAAFHLQLNQSVHFDRVFHRQLFYQGFDETVDDHRAGFLFG